MKTVQALDVLPACWRPAWARVNFPTNQTPQFHCITMTHFMILSGNRSGSTWLLSLMNALPGVYADFECQIVSEAVSQAHLPLGRLGTAWRDLLADSAKAQGVSARILGSKLVVPPQHSERLIAARD
ncbi:MAG: hypothetical protein R3245_02500, partial [Kiloniellales bacterium]|nr:hypothetical protein [Kiloniellales bacterium]